MGWERQFLLAEAHPFPLSGYWMSSVEPQPLGQTWMPSDSLWFAPWSGDSIRCWKGYIHQLLLASTLQPHLLRCEAGVPCGCFCSCCFTCWTISLILRWAVYNREKDRVLVGFKKEKIGKLSLLIRMCILILFSMEKPINNEWTMHCVSKTLILWHLGMLHDFPCFLV